MKLQTITEWVNEGKINKIDVTGMQYLNNTVLGFDENERLNLKDNKSGKVWKMNQMFAEFLLKHLRFLKKTGDVKDKDLKIANPVKIDSKVVKQAFNGVDYDNIFITKNKDKVKVKIRRKSTYNSDAHPFDVKEMKIKAASIGSNEYVFDIATGGHYDFIFYCPIVK